MVAARVALPVIEVQRPITRGDCLDHQRHPRPCVFVGCRHHLLHVVEQPDGDLLIGRESLDVDASPAEVERFTDRIAERVIGMKHTCSLDIADRGDQTLDVVGQAFRVTRERIRQLEAKALRNGFVPAAKRAALDEDLDD